MKGLTVFLGTLLACGQFYQTRLLQNMDSNFRRIDTMQPILDKLADKDRTKIRLAVHSLYLMNEGNPEVVVRLVAASDQAEAMLALREIGKWDTRVVKILSQMFPETISKEIGAVISESKKESAPAADSGSLWVYLGMTGTTGGRYKETLVDRIATGSVVTTDSVYVRSVIRGDIVGHRVRGQSITVQELKPMENGAIWGRIKP